MYLYETLVFMVPCQLMPPGTHWSYRSTCSAQSQYLPHFCYIYCENTNRRVSNHHVLYVGYWIEIWLNEAICDKCMCKLFWATIVSQQLAWVGLMNHDFNWFRFFHVTFANNTAALGVYRTRGSNFIYKAAWLRASEPIYYETFHWKYRFDIFKICLSIY